VLGRYIGFQSSSALRRKTSDLWRPENGPPTTESVGAPPDTAYPLRPPPREAANSSRRRAIFQTTLAVVYAHSRQAISHNARTLLRSQITTEDVGRAVLFFVTDQTPTTGATLPVDGGVAEAFPR